MEKTLNSESIFAKQYDKIDSILAIRANRSKKFAQGGCPSHTNRLVHAFNASRSLKCWSTVKWDPQL